MTFNELETATADQLRTAAAESLGWIYDKKRGLPDFLSAAPFLVQKIPAGYKIFTKERNNSGLWGTNLLKISGSNYKQLWTSATNARTLEESAEDLTRASLMAIAHVDIKATN